MIEAAVALMAGALTTLSPCVLPLLPFVLASAVEQHRSGPLALLAGINTGFLTLGLGVYGVSSAVDFGLDANTVRTMSAMVMLVFGAILLSSTLQQRVAFAGGRMTGGLNPLLERFSPQGLRGHFLLGLLLGIVWTPCSGPTLGAAIGLASSSDTIGQASWIMLLFGVGTSLPLLALAYGSRQALQRRRALLSRLGRSGKPVLGVILIAMGMMVIFGLDKVIEARLLNVMPGWLIDLTTRF